jgi:hypothetical protein
MRMSERNAESAGPRRYGPTLLQSGCIIVACIALLYALTTTLPN